MLNPAHLGGPLIRLLLVQPLRHINRTHTQPTSARNFNYVIHSSINECNAPTILIRRTLPQPQLLTGLMLVLVALLTSQQHLHWSPLMVTAGLIQFGSRQCLRPLPMTRTTIGSKVPYQPLVLMSYGFRYRLTVWLFNRSPFDFVWPDPSVSVDLSQRSTGDRRRWGEATISSVDDCPRHNSVTPVFGCAVYWWRNARAKMKVQNLAAEKNGAKIESEREK